MNTKNNLMVLGKDRRSATQEGYEPEHDEVLEVDDLGDIQKDPLKEVDIYLNRIIASLELSYKALVDIEMQASSLKVKTASVKTHDILSIRARVGNAMELAEVSKVEIEKIRNKE